MYSFFVGSFVNARSTGAAGLYVLVVAKYTLTWSYPVTFFCESEEQPASKSSQTKKREVFAMGEVTIRMLTQSRFCSLPTELVNPNCARFDQDANRCLRFTRPTTQSVATRRTWRSSHHSKR